MLPLRMRCPTYVFRKNPRPPPLMNAHIHITLYERGPSMIRTLRRTLAIVALALPSTFALAAGGREGTAQLFMVESPGCHYCLQWKEEIGPIYPKTAEGKFAPLQMIDIDDPLPAGVTFKRKAVYTPTFVLVQNGQEIGRIEGYPGEDFFWGLLEMMLETKTDFAAEASAESGT